MTTNKQQLPSGAEPDDTSATNAPWLQTVSAILDADARDLDASSASKLNRARHAALARFDPLRNRRQWLFKGVLGATVAALLVVAIVPRWQSQTVIDPAPMSNAAMQAEDFELLSSEDQLELYDNMDFYAWLDTQVETQDGPQLEPAS